MADETRLAALEEENALLRLQLEAVPDGVLVVDHNWRMVFFNRRFIDMWEIPPHIQECRDDRQSLQTVLDKLEDPEGFLARVEYLMDRREIACRDELRLRDGRVFERYTAPLTSESGEWRGRVWFFRDISERLQALEDRRRLEKMEGLRTMAAAVTHNFNNILTAILGNIELAELHPGPQPPAAYLARAKAAAMRAGDIGRRLLTYLGVSPVAPTTVDCVQTIRALVTELAAPLDVPVRLENTASCIPVECDPDHLREALANLLANSAEALAERSSAGGSEITVTVSAEPPPPQPPTFWAVPPPPAATCRITVSDNGPGLTAAEAEKAFDPFFSTKMMGRGLGLATVAGIARMLDGGVGIASAPGADTAIHLLLPRHGEALTSGT